MVLPKKQNDMPPNQVAANNVPPLDLSMHATNNNLGVDINVLNQYETALQLMNSEIQKLLMSNDNL